MKCPACGGSNPEGKQFCGDCGTRLVVRCGQCGAESVVGKKFCGDCGAAIAGVPAEAMAMAGAAGSPAFTQSAPPPPSFARETLGERRHLTVMFCDLVGSTEQAARMDPEEWYAIVADYHRNATAAAAAFGGYLAKNLGDGLMIYFGYPQAQENDAERSVRAGLAIIDAVALQNEGLAAADGPRLAVRVGIHAGPAMIGEAADVFGDVPNVAARVQNEAAPGSVLITQPVARQVLDLFLLEDEGVRQLKGVPGPTALFRVVRAETRRRHRNTAPTPLIGRDKELGVIASRWERARQGDGQLLLLDAEAGLGKSRLVEEFRASLAEMPHSWIDFTCIQLLQNTPLHPFVSFVKQRLEQMEPARERRLDALVRWHEAAGLDPSHSIPLVAALLDILLPAGFRSPPAILEERRRQLFAMLVAWLSSATRTQPLVVAVEDLHWADPSTIDLLRLLADRAASMPVLILLTARPEFRPPWLHRTHHTIVTLAPLPPPDIVRMVAEVAARQSLTREIIAAVVARTGGVPLFVEEVTRLLLEDHGLRDAGKIPVTLQASLAARLDRLGPARELAQIGAVIGREFEWRILRAVAGIPDAELARLTEQLAESDLIDVHGSPPDASYRFRHTLIQDTAYESLLRSRRQALHQRIVETLEADFLEIVATRPEVLAHHSRRGGLAAKAVSYYLAAGRLSVAKSANLEAINHLREGIEHLAAMPPGEERSHLELDLQLTLAQASIAVNGYAHADTTRAFERARELVEEVGDPQQRYAVLYGLYANHRVAGRLDLAGEAAARFLVLAEESGDPAHLCVAHRIAGILAWDHGDLTWADIHLSKAVRLYDPTQHGALALRFGSDIGMVAQIYLALTDLFAGKPDKAERVAERTLTRARQLGHALTLAQVLTMACLVHNVRDDPQALIRVGAEAVDFCQKNNIALFGASCRVMHSWAVARLGDPAEHLEEVRTAIADYAATGSVLARGPFRGLLAQLLLSAGKPEEGAAETATALVEIGATGEFLWRPEILRIRAECLAMTGNVEEAGRCLREAIAGARESGARFLELKAATTLTQLEPSAAHLDQLAAALAEFDGGETLSARVKARQVLEEGGR